MPLRSEGVWRESVLSLCFWTWTQRRFALMLLVLKMQEDGMGLRCSAKYCFTPQLGWASNKGREDWAGCDFAWSVLFPAPIHKSQPQLLQMSITQELLRALAGAESSPLHSSQEWELFLKIRKRFFSTTEGALTLQAPCHGPTAVSFSCGQQGY